MAKYRIVPKRDFGGQPFLINGRCVMSGFVVVANQGVFKGCNVMPGGTWSQDIPGALQMIKVLEKVGTNATGSSCLDANRFWKLLHRISGVTQRSREENARMMKALGMKLVRKDGNTLYYEPVTA